MMMEKMGEMVMEKGELYNLIASEVEWNVQALECVGLVNAGCGYR